MDPAVIRRMIFDQGKQHLRFCIGQMGVAAAVLFYLFASFFAGSCVASAETGRAYTDRVPAIVLMGDRLTSPVEGVFFGNREVLIDGSGPYRICGTLKDLCLHVCTKGEVTLILDGVEIVNGSDAALISDKKTDLRLVLAEGSENVLCSGDEKDLIPEKEATGAALTAKGNLDIAGTGRLEISGYLNNGIRCKKQMTVSEDAELRIRASNKAIRAEDLRIEAGRFETVSGGEGLYAEYSLTMAGGRVKVTTPDHCLKSEGTVRISGGELTAESAEKCGIVAVRDISVSGGSLTLNVLNDGIRAETGIEISGGQLMIVSGDDGLKIERRADTATVPIILSGGEVNISSYGEPINVEYGYTLDGGRLFATGIIDGDSRPSKDNLQAVFFEGVRGRKHDLLTLDIEGEETRQMEASYGYNTVIISCPGDLAMDQIDLTIGGAQ